MFVFQSGFQVVFVFQYGFRRLCLCFDVDFKLGFQLCLHFGFVFRVWVSASLCILGWVFAVCSQSVGFDLGCSYFYSFFGFSYLDFAHISALFFFFFVLLHWFLMGFGHSGGIAIVRWFPD